MATPTTPLVENDPHEKPKKKGLLAIVAIAVAGLAGLAAFSDNLSKVADSGHKLCLYMHLCTGTPAPPPPLPSLAGYDSPGMGGGHNQIEQCGPLLQKYVLENPQFNIVIKSWEDNDKDMWGHVTYHYHCRYAATLK